MKPFIVYDKHEIANALFNQHKNDESSPKGDSIWSIEIYDKATNMRLVLEDYNELEIKVLMPAKKERGI